MAGLLWRLFLALKIGEDGGNALVNDLRVVAACVAVFLSHSDMFLTDQSDHTRGHVNIYARVCCFTRKLPQHHVLKRAFKSKSNI